MNYDYENFSFLTVYRALNRGGGKGGEGEKHYLIAMFQVFQVICKIVNKNHFQI